MIKAQGKGSKGGSGPPEYWWLLTERVGVGWGWGELRVTQTHCLGRASITDTTRQRKRERWMTMIRFLQHRAPH